MATKEVREQIGYKTLEIDGMDRQSVLAEINREFDAAEAQGYTDVRLDWQQQRYDEGYEYVFRGSRPETAEETIVRERQEGITRMTIEKREREQLAALRAKYG